MLGHFVKQFCRRIAYNQQSSSLVRYESKFYRVLDEIQKTIEETTRVQDTNGSFVNADLCPRPIVKVDS